jgi:uncharacterized protein (TIGR00266 family)
MVSMTLPVPQPKASALAQGNELKFSLECRPDFALLVAHLDAGQKLLAEPEAMASMDPSVELKAGFKGGFGKTMGRMLGGESMIVNTFTAQGRPAEVTLAPATPGDIVHYPLRGNGIMLQRGAYLASTPGVDVSGKWAGARGFFGGQGLVLLKATGSGDLFFNSYGAILELDVTQGFVVDTGYVVAFEDTLTYNVTTLPGLRPSARIKTFLLGGEGLVCQFQGRGRVWVQTRTAGPFLSWVWPYRPMKKSRD